MKKIVLFLSIVIVFCVAQASAQNRGAEMQAKRIQMLKDSLQLTDVQVDSVNAVDKDFMPQQREIFMDQSMSREDKMAKLQDLNAAKKLRYKNFLTDDQIAKLTAMEQRMREQMRKQRGGGGQ
jgi:hypothetical protein